MAIDITGRDLIALAVIIGGMYLLSIGIDGVVASILIGIVGYYFGARYREVKTNKEVSDSTTSSSLYSLKFPLEHLPNRK